jgi:hypothetical protein
MRQKEGLGEWRAGGQSCLKGAISTRQRAEVGGPSRLRVMIEPVSVATPTLHKVSLPAAAKTDQGDTLEQRRREGLFWVSERS